MHRNVPLSMWNSRLYKTLLMTSQICNPQWARKLINTLDLKSQIIRLGLMERTAESSSNGWSQKQGKSLSVIRNSTQVIFFFLVRQVNCIKEKKWWCKRMGGIFSFFPVEKESCGFPPFQYKQKVDFSFSFPGFLLSRLI